MYRNNILNFQESTTILNAGKKKSGNLLKAPRRTISVSVVYREKESDKNSCVQKYNLFLFLFFIITKWSKQLLEEWVKKS